MKILVACEESQIVTIELRKLGHEAYSCDLVPCTGGHPEWHIQGDVLDRLQDGWDMLIAFPPCTYMTCSAEWAYTDGPYHQKVKSGTLVGLDRRNARNEALNFVRRLLEAPIEKIALENPVGVISSRIRKPDQIIQPYYFGEDASKKTCLWLKNLPPLIHTQHVPGRIVNGKERWGNQTDSGQNRLSPSDDRATIRSKTYPGIAKAMAKQWTDSAYYHI